MIPTWRPPTTTPQVPNPAPVPEVRAQAPGKAIKDPFAHFSHTFTNETGYLRVTDLEYYARFKLGELFTGLMYMAIYVLTADQRPAMPPRLSSLANLVNALRSLGLGVAAAYINDNVVDIYTRSNRSLPSVRADILEAVRRHMPTDVILLSDGEGNVYWARYISGHRSRGERSVERRPPGGRHSLDILGLHLCRRHQLRDWRRLIHGGDSAGGVMPWT